MLDQVVHILRDNRLASLATVDPEGWPHCTMVGFASHELRIYFAIARDGQKFSDISRDNRVSLAIGRDVINPSSIRALAIKARSNVIDDGEEHRRALDMLLSKRPALKLLAAPNNQSSAIMVALPEQIRLLDYSKGYGHSVLLDVDPDGKVLDAKEQVHNWGYGREFKPVE